MRLVLLDSAAGPIVRVLLREEVDVLVVCRRDEYEAARAEDREPRCIGFKRRDLIDAAAPHPETKKEE